MQTDELWRRVSRDELFEGLGEWRRLATRAQVVLLTTEAGSGPWTVDVVAARVGIGPAEARELLDRLASQGVLSHAGSDAYGPGDEQALVGLLGSCCESASRIGARLAFLARSALGPDRSAPGGSP